jgi:hypothetical protein
MEQMLVWAFVHREYARRYGKPQRADDAFYDNYPDAGRRRWNPLGGLFSRRERGR